MLGRQQWQHRWQCNNIDSKHITFCNLKPVLCTITLTKLYFLFCGFLRLERKQMKEILSNSSAKCIISICKIILEMYYILNNILISFVLQGALNSSVWTFTFLGSFEERSIATETCKQKSHLYQFAGLFTRIIEYMGLWWIFSQKNPNHVMSSYFKAMANLNNHLKFVLADVRFSN